MPDAQLATVSTTPSQQAIQVRVAQTTLEAEDTRSFLIEEETGADLPEWTPGAHIDVRLPGNMIRQYSLCGDPSERGRWRIGVLREPQSRGGSAYLHDQVRAGTTLEVSAPRNNFVLQSGTRYVFIAGGIGITPLLPMIRQVEDSGAEWRLHYGGRHESRMAFLGELGRYGDKVALYPQDESGLLPLDDVLGATGENTLVYCCGPEALLTAVEDSWRGRPSEQLRIERFHPREMAGDPGADEPFEVRIHSTGKAVRVGSGESILDALGREGFDVPSSCREGTCATCETNVVDGTVDHRDSILSEEERESGKTMMICVSRARSRQLILDL